MCRTHYKRWWKKGGTVGSDALVRPVPEWTATPEAEVHWPAGLLEGEGAFSPGTRSSPGSILVSVKMCDRDVIERAAHLMRGSGVWVTHRGSERGWRPVYTTAAPPRRAETLMHRLRPLMGMRRRSEIDRALACRAQLRYIRLIPAPPHCVMDGCQQKPEGRGLCHQHYLRWLRHEGSSAIKESRKTGANMK